MTFRTWTGGSFSYGTGSAWSPPGVPQPGDTLLVQTGTVTLRNATLQGVQVELAGAAATPPVLAITNVTIGRTSTVAAGNFVYDPTNYSFAGTIRATGWNTNLGTLTATSGDFQRAATLTLYIAAGQGMPGQFTNAGTIGTNPMGSLIVHAGTTGATLVNNGLVDVSGHATLDAAVTGTGTIRLEAAIPLHGFVAAPQITADYAVGAGQTIRFLGGDDLRLADPAQFQGKLAGFSNVSAYGAQDRIDVVGHDITAADYAGDATGGVLTLHEGAAVAGRLHFAGSYTSNEFVLTHGSVVTASGALVQSTAITLA